MMSFPELMLVFCEINESHPYNIVALLKLSYLVKDIVILDFFSQSYTKYWDIYKLNRDRT